LVGFAQETFEGALDGTILHKLSLFKVVQKEELCAHVCIGVIGNDGLVSRVLRCTVGEMEIVRITHGDLRVPKLRRLIVYVGRAGVEFLLQQVDVRIARWAVSWDSRELGQNERNGLFRFALFMIIINK
jgi:hypothetical protein